MYLTQKFLKKVFAFVVLGVYSVGFGVVVGTRTNTYNRVIGDYALVNQSKQRHLSANNTYSQVVNNYEYLDIVQQEVYVYSKFNVFIDNFGDDDFPEDVYFNPNSGDLRIVEDHHSRYGLQNLSTYYQYMHTSSPTNNSNLIIENGGDGNRCRFFLPNNSSVSSIYVKINRPFNFCYLGTGNIPSILSLSYTIGSSGDFLLYDSSYITTANQSGNNDSYTSRFSKFWFYFDDAFGDNWIDLEFWCCGALDADYQEGYANGYTNGYISGYNDGQNYVLGHSDEFDLYTYAQYIAYGNLRYSQGLDDGGQVLSLSAVMNSIFTAPISMFMQIFRSGAFVWTMPTGEVLDLGGLMTFFLTIGIALAVVRLIMKVGGK